MWFSYIRHVISCKSNQRQKIRMRSLVFTDFSTSAFRKRPKGFLGPSGWFLINSNHLTTATSPHHLKQSIKKRPEHLFDFLPIMCPLHIFTNLKLSASYCQVTPVVLCKRLLSWDDQIRPETLNELLHVAPCSFILTIVPLTCQRQQKHPEIMKKCTSYMQSTTGWRFKQTDWQFKSQLLAI